MRAPESGLGATRTSDLVRAIARHKTNAVQMSASLVDVRIVGKLFRINTVCHLASALLAAHTCILLDMPVEIVA